MRAMGIMDQLRSPRSRWQRLRLALSYYKGPFASILPWLLQSREHTNFTYDLTPLNEAHLAAFVAIVVSRPLTEIEAYLEELKCDQELAAHFQRQAEERGAELGMDQRIRFGRRFGWYALARATKPRVVVETGVDKGLGTCVLAAALRRNAAEGWPGRVFGTDINPAAGALLSGPYAGFGEILIGDSIESLGRMTTPIDLFINDSDHFAQYESREYAAVRDKLSSGAIIVGDNAHVTNELFLFARATRRRFLFFREQPLDHWYPGGGIGVAFGQEE